MDTQLRKRQANKASKLKHTIDPEEDENIIQEVVRAIESLYEMRFVEKISRPIDRKVKEDYI